MTGANTASVADAPILEVRGLVKTYGKVEAVRGVSFAIRKGICFGLLGPNGAGKTTTIEMIEGIVKPTGGEILYQGTPADARFRETIGIQFQTTALPDFLTVREVLKLFKAFYKDPADIEELIRWCALDEFVDRDAGKLSGGQRQRLLLALGLINNPHLVFLDEPTTGLDPQARRNFWDLIQELKRKGKTIVLTTHYMEEAYVLCDEIAIMDHGQIIAHGPPDTLLKTHFNGLSIQLAKQDVRIPFDSIPGRVFEKDGLVEIQTDQVDATLRTLVEKGVPLSSLRVRQRDLEDLFLALTGKAIRA
jgi:ABC-2 type transport system ATP-binding protein